LSQLAGSSVFLHRLSRAVSTTMVARSWFVIAPADPFVTIIDLGHLGS
jgi:hypothetical protein